MYIDSVSGKLRHGYVDLSFDHVLHSKREIADRNLVFHTVVHPVNALITVAGKMHHCFAHRLTGNCSCINTCSADNLALLNQRDTLAEFGALNGGTLSGGSRADHDEVIFLH